MEISEKEYKRLKAIEVAHSRAVDVQSKWRAVAAVTRNNMHLELLNELRGALMASRPTPHEADGLNGCGCVPALNIMCPLHASIQIRRR